MTAATTELLYELLVASLPAWHIVGEVRREGDGTIVVSSNNRSLHVTAASADMPFRWMVASSERTRGAASIVGVLRAVRSALDRGYVPVRLRIAPSTVMPA